MAVTDGELSETSSLSLLPFSLIKPPSLERPMTNLAFTPFVTATCRIIAHWPFYLPVVITSFLT